MEVSSSLVQSLGMHPVLGQPGTRPRLAALSKSRSHPHLCLCSALVLAALGERYALAEYARDTQPQCDVRASQELWAEHCSQWLSSSSKKQSGLRRAPLPACLYLVAVPFYADL